MLSRLPRANTHFAHHTKQSADWAEVTAVVRKVTKGFLATVHHTLLVLGVTAITMLCMMYFNPALADRLKAMSPFTDAAKPAVAVPPLTELLQAPHAIAPQTNVVAAVATASDAAPTAGADTSRQQRWVTNWLSKRYHIAGDATKVLVSASYNTGKETQLDPLLILAVMSIESGLNPFAESAMGAQGLMQVMSKVHHDKFEDMGGVKAALNPVANIRVGALILKDYVNRGGSVEAGLKLYVGAAAFDNDAGYGTKVMAEYQRLKEVSNGKNVPTFTPPMAAAPVKRPIESADAGKPGELAKGELASL
ncbi:MAG: lytic transglycosylase domain-containing protein [Burkholderiaceae bacterium]|nr:lytic transglycosylase domain-containing protein [Burkholderiaceae bacterium]